MAITINLELKNSLSITNEGKTGAETTWEESEELYSEANASGITWATAGTPIRKESKNTLTISNESKN